MYIDANIAFEYAILRFDCKRVDIQSQFAGYQIGDLIDHPDVVHPDDPDAGEEGDLFILCPFGLDHAVTIVGQQFSRVGAIGPVDRQSLSDGHEAKDVVTGNGFTAIGQGIDNTVAAFTEDDQLCIFSWHGLACNRLCEPMLNGRFDRFGRFQPVAQQVEFLKLLQVDVADGDLVKEVER